MKKRDREENIQKEKKKIGRMIDGNRENEKKRMKTKNGRKKVKKK